MRHIDLVELARGKDAVIVVPYHAGQFVTKGATLVEVYEAPSQDEEFETSVQGAFAVGAERAAGRDIEFYIDQLVEIAVRALSPGINDPFTAMASIDQLGASLRELAERRLPPPYHRDEEGMVRVQAESQTFQGAVDAAFTLIRQYGVSSAPVTIRLLETLAVLAEYTPSDEHRESLLSHARMIRSGAMEQMQERADIEVLQQRFDQVVEALEAGSTR